MQIFGTSSLPRTLVTARLAQNSVATIGLDFGDFAEKIQIRYERAQYRGHLLRIPS